MKAYELKNWIEEKLPNPVPQDNVDGIFAGDSKTEVKGVAITFLPNICVLEKAAEKGLNFIIGHEPIFYSHPWFYPNGDNYMVPMMEAELEQKKSSPPGVRKQKIINENNLVFYRLHDAWNDFPDRGMGIALEKVLGLEGKRITQEAWIYEISQTNLVSLAKEISVKLGKKGIQFIGDPQKVVKRLSLDWGSPGAIDILNRGLAYDIDVAITGEVIEWRDVEYARDVDISLILGGHHSTETPGMKFFFEWFKKNMPEIPAEYIDAGDPDLFIVNT